MALDEEFAAAPQVLRLAEFYGLNGIGGRGDLDTRWHPLLWDDAARRAAYGRVPSGSASARSGGA